MGPIARTVACCAALDAILSGEPCTAATADVASLRLLAPTNYVLDGADDAVLRAFERSLQALRATGAVRCCGGVGSVDRLPLQARA